MEYKTWVMTNKYIQQHCRLIITNMDIMYRNDDEMVPGVAVRNIWYVDIGSTTKWGGVQIKKELHGAPH